LENLTLSYPDDPSYPEASKRFFQNAAAAILHRIAILIIDFPAGRLGIDRVIAGLERSSLSIDRRLEKVRARPENLETLTHVIGIERWGQRRVRVALGEPLSIDEHDSYLPDYQDWSQLCQTFRAVRQETISLSKSLRMAGVDTATRIFHNQLGDISLLGWLFYLDLHAALESRRIN
jgi:hypothetical protein